MPDVNETFMGHMGQPTANLTYGTFMGHMRHVSVIEEWEVIEAETAVMNATLKVILQNLGV